MTFSLDNPSGMQKSWREWVRATGSILDYRTPCEIHHPAGRTAVQDKVPIGHWFLLPLTKQQHSWVDDGIEGLDMMKAIYQTGHGFDDADVIDDMTLHEFERYLFEKVIDRAPPPPPFDKQTRDAIQGWHR